MKSTAVNHNFIIAKTNIIGAKPSTEFFAGYWRGRCQWSNKKSDAKGYATAAEGQSLLEFNALFNNNNITFAVIPVK